MSVPPAWAAVERMLLGRAWSRGHLPTRYSHSAKKWHYSENSSASRKCSASGSSRISRNVQPQLRQRTLR